MPDYRAMARAAAEKYGVDPDIFERQINQESGFAEDVITGQRRSSAGATGIAQLMPAHWAAVNPLDPAAALDYAARLMANHLQNYGGDYALALAAYNAGPGNVEQYGGVPPFEETQNYVRNILGGTGGSTSSGMSTAERKQYQTEIDQANADYDALRERYLADPNSVSLDDLIQARSRADDAQARLDDLDAVGYGYAQDAFENSIALGDYQRRQADSAWSRWLDKRSMAEDAAKSEIATRQGHNLEQGKVEAQRQQNFGQGPQASTITYLPQNYEDVLQKYMDKFEVGDAPSADPASYGGPGIPTRPSKQYQDGAGYPQNEQSGPWSTVFGADPNAASSDFDARDYLNSTLYPTAPRRENRTYSEDWALDEDAAKRRQGDSGGGGRDLGDRVLSSLIKVPFVSAPMALGGLAAKKKWWQKGRGLIGFANGTMNAPGGLARVGEKGPETMIDPRTGQPVIVGEYGPEVRDVPQGAEVYPNDVPPDEAFAFSQMQRAVAGSAQGRPQSQAEMAARANDPQLQQKVLAALTQAIVAQTVATPPPTPGLAGVWSKPDPWADFRPLSTPAVQQQV